MVIVRRVTRQRFDGSRTRGGVAKPVVVLGARNDPGATHDAYLAAPCVAQSLRGQIDEALHGVGTRNRVGQVA